MRCVAAPTTTSCVAGWSQPAIGQSMVGGVYQRSITVDDCKLACISTAGCIGIDVYILAGSTLYCYLLTTATALVAAPSFYHYDLQLNPNCISASQYTKHIVTFDKALINVSRFNVRRLF
jgi:hypothetical protein